MIKDDWEVILTIFYTKLCLIEALEFNTVIIIFDSKRDARIFNTSQPYSEVVNYSII